MPAHDVVEKLQASSSDDYQRRAYPRREIHNRKLHRCVGYLLSESLVRELKVSTIAYSGLRFMELSEYPERVELPQEDN